MTTNIDGDLNQTIAAAVNARIEAEVMKALSGDEVLGAYVVAALSAPAGGDPYARKKQTVLQKAISDAVTGATKTAILKVVEEDIGRLEDEVRKCFRRDADKLAKSVVDGLAGQLGKGFGIQVSLNLPWTRDL
jgi:hypothetical protein